MPQKTIEAIDKTKTSYGKQAIILLFSVHSFKVKRSVILEENEYNHEGIRISREEGSVNRRYFHDQRSVAYTKDGSVLSTANVRSLDGEIIGSYRGSSYYLYTEDIQGSTGHIVDSSVNIRNTYDYSDFGEVTLSGEAAIENEICYTGAVYDASTGLHYLNARYYDPENGRFISQDSYRGGLDEIQQWHLYAYCANNPTNYTDPSGHLATSTVAFFIDLGLGLVSCGVTFKVNAALKILKTEVFGKDLKKISQKVARNKSKIRTKFRSLYYKIVKSKKITKALRKVNDGPLWKYNVLRHSNKYVQVIEGNLKSSALGKVVDKLVGQFVDAGVYLTLTAFSSIGNFIAAMGEIAYDNKYDGEYSR